MSRVWAKRAFFAAIILLLPIQFLALKALGSEPYPALFMPSFGSVPQSDGAVRVASTSVTAETSDGAVFSIDPVTLMPNKTKLGESIAGYFFADEKRVSAAAQSGWLLERVQAQFSDENFVSLTVERRTVLVNPHTRETVDEIDYSSYVVQLEARE